ncbi:DUF2809 domain-containing protein [Streptomyces sp. NPDC056568]|uniref:ribosomal maturation YjgA family protein n=1 Tax=Streptomyces sp. NPDC056568 TaxID=3345866 RepID=UPI0036B766A0
MVYPSGPGADADGVLLRTRGVAAVAAVSTVAAGLGLRAAAEGEVAKYGGDALYTLLLFTLVVLVAPRVTAPRAAALALAVSWGVEFLQLSDLPAELSRRSTAARLVLGSTFNAPDLFWYAVGAAVGWSAGHLARRAVRPDRPGVRRRLREAEVSGRPPRPTEDGSRR